VNRLSLQDPQISRLSDAIAQRVGAQRFALWFSKSAKFDLRNDSLEINVPNDFIGEWIDEHFAAPIREATHEVFGSALPVRFNVMPQLFESVAFDPDLASRSNQAASGLPRIGLDLEPKGIHPDLRSSASHSSTNSLSGSPLSGGAGNGSRSVKNGHRNGQVGLNHQKPDTQRASEARPGFAPAGRFATPTPPAIANIVRAGGTGPIYGDPTTAHMAKSRLKHCLGTFVEGPTNKMALSTAGYVSEFPGGQYNPLFVHGGCGLGKTHLLQGICRRFAELHPTKKWIYLTGEDFTNEYLTSLRNNRVDAFRRKMRELDLLVIDDVHFLGGKKATQEEFLHTFNAIEATGKQVVMASDEHPRQIADFSESLVNRFVSGMCVRIDPPNFITRCEILRQMAVKQNLTLADEVVDWVARRVTQSVRELEGALNRIRALSRLEGHAPDINTVRAALGDLDRQMVAPLRPDNILHSVCQYFGLDNKELMSGRRHRTISLARSVAMYLVRKNSKLSFPEIAGKLGKRNHSTVISACRRIDKAVTKNETLEWESSIGDRADEAQELVQRLEEQARSIATAS